MTGLQARILCWTGTRAQSGLGLVRGERGGLRAVGNAERNGRGFSGGGVGSDNFPNGSIFFFRAIIQANFCLSLVNVIIRSIDKN